MKNILKIELKKAFSGPSFKTAMLISCFFCLISILYEYGLYQYQKPYIEYWADKYPVSQVFTLYSSWILIEQNSIGRTLFFFWIPVVASIPFATSFYVEEKKRQLRMVLVRAKRRDYFVAKYFAVFLAGASVIAIPLALDFMVSAALYHAEVPIVIFPYFGVMSGEMWSEIRRYIWRAFCRYNLYFKFLHKKAYSCIGNPAVSIFVYRYCAKICILLESVYNFK